jgi:hypothetical protein
MFGGSRCQCINGSNGNCNGSIQELLVQLNHQSNDDVEMAIDLVADSQQQHQEVTERSAS